MAHDQGVLHTVPIPEAMGYLMLRPLLADVPEDDMCGVTVNQVFPVSRKWHEPMLPALTGLPAPATTPKHPVMVVKIDNTANSTPQIGLGSADMVVAPREDRGAHR